MDKNPTIRLIFMWLGWLNLSVGIFGGLMAVWIKLNGDTRPIELQAIGLGYLIAGLMCSKQETADD